MSMNKYLKLIRIKQWIKKGVVFIPLVFSLSFKDSALILNSFLAFLAFSFCASGVYIRNDLADVLKDRNHPKKKFRPIPSGEIKMHTAHFLSVAMFLLSFITLYMLNIKCLLIMCLYILINYFYTKHLKQIPILDIGCIASGFILRVLIGCFAISVTPSAYLILATFFASTFFGFYKRMLEINLKTDNTREVLSKYNKNILENYILVSGSLFIAFYTFYTLNRQLNDDMHSEYLYLSVFPLIYMAFRLIFLMHKDNKNDDPSELFYSDRHIQLSAIIYIGIVIVLVA